VKQCEYCNLTFKPKVSYQIYCSSDCRNKATKNKIVERYQVTRIQKRIGKKRICLGGCKQQLSIYNESGFCQNCNIHKKAVEKMLKEIKGYFDYEQYN
jgi:hypothetical protein